MSDSSTSIVPRLSNYPDRATKAKEVVDWLISKKAIKSNKSDCILSSDEGYPIDIGAMQLTNDPDYLPFELLTNGLQVVTDRTVFHTGQNGLESFICPLCNEDIVNDDWDFKDFAENGNLLLTCPLCNTASELNDYIIEPEWGFSNLGFTFWNWADFTDAFIEEFEKRLGCKVKVVESHI